MSGLFLENTKTGITFVLSINPIMAAHFNGLFLKIDFTFHYILVHHFGTIILSMIKTVYFILENNSFHNLKTELKNIISNFLKYVLKNQENFPKNQIKNQILMTSSYITLNFSKYVRNKKLTCEKKISIKKFINLKLLKKNWQEECEAYEDVKIYRVNKFVKKYKYLK